ncbi:MAG TPA: alpha/beta fold hydrolase [Xanthomonadales bacterium]
MSDRLVISTRGQGPELVLLHGWAMHSGIWGGLVDDLAAEFRVNLVDLPGHGVNRHVQLSPDLNEVAEQILSCVPPAVWLGWSLGGLVTLAAALRQPQSVRKAVPVAATPCFSKRPGWDCGVDIDTQQAFSDGLENDPEATLARFWLQCFDDGGASDSMQRLGKSSVSDDLPTQDAMQTGLRLLYSNDLSAELSTCRVPTLFVGGTRDRTIRPESFSRAAALMPDASCSLIRAGSHAPFISHPDRFLDIIRGFLNGDKTE